MRGKTNIQEFNALQLFPIKLLSVLYFGLIPAEGAQTISPERLPIVAWNAEGFVAEGGKVELASQQGDQVRITVTGIRITKGTAVDCPQIRTDDGRIYSISYLAPSVAVGDRVEVTGMMANSATCSGPVLNAEKVSHKK
jgi:hypothetical protein